MPNKIDLSQLIPPKKPILKRKGFQFDGETFSVDGIPRVDGARLHELCNPSTLPDKRDQTTAKLEARRLFTKSFFVAQLKYYGIPFKTPHRIGELSSLLPEAVRQGKCNSVRESVQQIEAELRADYEPLRQKWQAEYDAWAAEKKRRDDEAFAKCKTPSERANCDVQRFLDMYFLTDGKPDKSKTPEPLTLSELGTDSRLTWKAKEIPGLHTRWCGSSSGRDICIGWDSEEVTALADAITERAKAAEEARHKAEWEQTMARHKKYLDQISETGSGRDKETETFDLNRCLGSYIIQCDEIANGWGDDYVQGHKLTMDISKGKDNTLRAAYNWGIIEGTMILSQSEDTLKVLFGAEATDSEASESDEEGSPEDGEDNEEKGNAKKRKAGDSAAAYQTSDAKRRKTGTTPSPPRRLYFRLFGRETGEGGIIPDPDSGHIDFPSDSYATFTGLVKELTWVANNVEFKGYKVSDKPRKKPQPWETYQGGRYGSVLVPF